MNGGDAARVGYSAYATVRKALISVGGVLPSASEDAKMSGKRTPTLDVRALQRHTSGKSF